MRAAESGRGKRSPSRDFLSVVMKWPFNQDGPSSPVSPGSNRKVVGPSAPWLPNGTIRTDSTRSPALRESSDTTRTQRRTGGFPSMAVQISPRRGSTLWLVKVYLLRRSAQGGLQIGIFRRSLGREALEISGSLTLQSSPVFQPASPFHRLVNCLSDAGGSTRLHHIVKVRKIVRADGSRELLALQHISYFR